MEAEANEMQNIKVQYTYHRASSDETGGVADANGEERRKLRICDNKIHDHREQCPHPSFDSSTHHEGAACHHSRIVHVAHTRPNIQRFVCLMSICTSRKSKHRRNDGTTFRE